MPKRCFPACKYFKCTQGSLTLYRGSPHCGWIEGNCEGPSCGYASCIRGRLLAGGICGFTVKRKTITEEIPEERYELRVKGKVLRKISKEELI